MKLHGDSLEDLSTGAVFLATGGGGDPCVSFLLARQVLHECGPVDLVAVNELADDAHVVAIGGVGAPSVGLELLPSIGDAERALRAYEQYVQRDVDAVVSFEIGVGCPDYYRKPEALAVVAPRCFGFEFDYLPIEDLAQAHCEI